MNLYERTGAKTSLKSDAAIFVRDTYMYFALSLVTATIAAFLGATFLAPMLSGNLLANIVIIAIEIFLIIGISSKKTVTNGAIALLFAFSFVSGLSLTSIIWATLQSQYGATLIAQALFLTMTAFAGLSVFAFTTKKDFSVFAKVAFITLIIVIVASLLNLFFQNSTLHIVISSVVALLFSYFIIYDTQMMLRGYFQTPIQAALNLYLDFINLFVSLLNILRSFKD